MYSGWTKLASGRGATKFKQRWTRHIMVLGWAHLERKPNSNIARQALKWNPQGNRKMGRPKHVATQRERVSQTD